MSEELEFRIVLALKLVLQVHKDKSYAEWAQKWISGEDRSRESAANAAYATANAAYAVYAAAYAAAYAAYASHASHAAHAISGSLRTGAKLSLVVKFVE